MFLNLAWSVSESYTRAQQEVVGSMTGSGLMVFDVQEVGLDDHNNPSDFIMCKSFFKNLLLLQSYFSVTLY